MVWSLRGTARTQRSASGNTEESPRVGHSGSARESCHPGCRCSSLSTTPSFSPSCTEHVEYTMRRTPGNLNACDTICSWNSASFWTRSFPVASPISSSLKAEPELDLESTPEAEVEKVEEEASVRNNLESSSPSSTVPKQEATLISSSASSSALSTLFFFPPRCLFLSAADSS